MQKLVFDIIGTRLQISVDTSSSCEEVFCDIRERLMAFESRFSRFIDGNWLSHLNKDRRAYLDDDARMMLTFALKLAYESGGYFDPTVGSILSRLGYGVSAERGNANSCDYRSIVIEGNSVSLEGDVLLEFGGVGKGYLLDVLKDMLRMYDRFLINFGGDLYGKGMWKVGLEHPQNLDEAIGVMILRDDFLACSSGSRRKWGNHHHLIDPHIGASAQSVLATYIEAKNGMMADGYATTLCVMGFKEASDLLEKTIGIEGVLVGKGGNIFQSKGSKGELFLNPIHNSSSSNGEL